MLVEPLEGEGEGRSLGRAGRDEEGLAALKLGVAVAVELDILKGDDEGSRGHIFWEEGGEEECVVAG